MLPKRLTNLYKLRCAAFYRYCQTVHYGHGADEHLPRTLGIFIDGYQALVDTHR